jgi:hypothetical protein
MVCPCKAGFWVCAGVIFKNSTPCRKKRKVLFIVDAMEINGYDLYKKCMFDIYALKLVDF